MPPVRGSCSELSSLEPSIQRPSHPDVPKRQLGVSKESLFPPFSSHLPSRVSSPSDGVTQAQRPQRSPYPVSRPLPALRSHCRMFLSLLTHLYLCLLHPKPGPSSLSRRLAQHPCRFPGSVFHPLPTLTTRPASPHACSPFLPSSLPEASVEPSRGQPENVMAYQPLPVRPHRESTCRG